MITMLRKLSLSALLLLGAMPLHAGLFGDTGKGKIKEILRSPAIASVNIGMKVVDVASGKKIFAENSAKLFVPASNAKLLTAYAALKVLTPGYVFRTDFATDVFVDSRTVHTLYIKGYGDPSVTLADINLQVFSLTEKIGEVDGDVVVDNSYFDTLQFGHGWMWDEGIVAWNAPIAPYAMQGDCIDIYVRPGSTPGEPVGVRASPATAYAVVVSSAVTADVDSIRIERETTAAGDRFIVAGSMSTRSPEMKWRCTVSRPGLYAATLFKELLTRYGVRVKGSAYETDSSTAVIRISSYNSRNLAAITRFFVKESDNLTGENILKTLGAVRYGAPGSAEKGIAAIKEVLRARGIAATTYTLADGSGLSTYDQLSPDILVEVLRAAYEDFSFAPEFTDALSVAGRDGTMKDRLRGSALAGSLRAKTGTMSGISCIAGYLRTRKGRTLAVSIMMNGFAGPSDTLKAAQDALLTTLWEYY
jgi:D-alanyl-D-alanine carboxypeptidase/D-alanyl-D-alanine-endopeptidase (penicillin-binding protein 4)